jgi:uncharacterized metal-binding protein YceD (DUF177 family)
MRILVTTIPFSGMEISSTICKESLNQRVSNGARIAAIEFLEDPKVSLMFTRTHGGVIARGTITSPCNQDCASCGDIKPHTVTATLEWVLQTESDRAAPEDTIEDPGVIFYSGEHVELEEHLQEALILSVSPFWKPPLEENGACSGCQKNCMNAAVYSDSETQPSNDQNEPQNTSKATSLGALLQKAMLSKN